MATKGVLNEEKTCSMLVRNCCFLPVYHSPVLSLLAAVGDWSTFLAQLLMPEDREQYRLCSQKIVYFDLSGRSLRDSH